MMFVHAGKSGLFELWNYLISFVSSKFQQILLSLNYCDLPDMRDLGYDAKQIDLHIYLHTFFLESRQWIYVHTCCSSVVVFIIPKGKYKSFLHPNVMSSAIFSPFNTRRGMQDGAKQTWSALGWLNRCFVDQKFSSGVLLLLLLC